MPQFREASTGLFIIECQTGTDLEPSEQGSLIQAVERAGSRGTTALIFHLAPGIRVIDPRVPAYWLQVTARPELKLAAMAFVSGAINVRIAATGFRLAHEARGIPVMVQQFLDPNEAFTWAQARIAARAAAA